MSLVPTNTANASEMVEDGEVELTSMFPILGTDNLLSKSPTFGTNQSSPDGHTDGFGITKEDLDRAEKE